MIRRRALYGGIREEDKFKYTNSVVDYETITIPATGTNDFIVDWGDGSAFEHVTSVNPTHLYTIAGNYQISLWGEMPNFAFNNGDNKLNLISFEQSGNVGLSSGFNMFLGCSNLINVHEIDTSAFTTVLQMFRGCSKLPAINGNLDLTNVSGIGASGLFRYCSKLVTLPLILDFNNCTNLNNCFQGCTSLIDASSVINTHDATTMSLMFGACSSLSVMPDNLDFNSCTNTSSMFSGCTALQSLPLFLNFNNVSSLSSMFSNCSSLTFISSGFNTYKATSLVLLFYRCTSLLNVLDTLNLSSATNCAGMFDGCSSLTEVKNIINMNDSPLLDVNTMFRGCVELTCIGQELNTTGVGVDKTDVFLNTPLLQHPTLAEQTDLTDVDGAVYTHTCI